MIKFVFDENGNRTKEYSTNDYQKETLRTLRAGSYEDQCANMCMGMCGEIGEVVDMMKKHIYQGKELDINDVIEEVGDVLWYLSNFCNINKITLEECMYNNSMKLKKRYPNGFTVEDALARVDKEQ